MKLLLVILVYFTFYERAASTTDIKQIKVGAFFFENEIDIEKSFENAVKRINTEGGYNFRLFPIIRRLSDADGSITLQRETCDLIQNGVAAIFGPSSQIDTDIVSLICNSTGIPHILFDLSQEEEADERANHQMTVNVFPNLLILSKAYADIVNNFVWRKFTLVYDADDEKALMRLQDLLQLRNIHKDTVRVRKFKATDDYRLLWKNIKNERRIVLDCPPHLLLEILNASIQFNLMGDRNHLFLTNLETHSTSLEDLRDNVTFAVNATAARLMLNGNFYNANKWQLESLYNFDSTTSDTPRTLLPDLIFDAVYLFASATRNASLSGIFTLPSVTCEFAEFSDERAWFMGTYIVNTMKTTSGVGNTNFRTSNLQLDNDGQRVNFNIELYKPLSNNVDAYWDTKGHITPTYGDAKSNERKIYRVATRVGPPYFMINKTAQSQNITGNGLYEGYAAELIAEIAKEMNFEYIFSPVADNAYGQENKETKQWNGIIGELINGDADMGICDLTITQARKQVVDFTVPFMQLGISILAFKSPVETKSALAFLDPFVVDVWVYVMIAIFIIIFLMVFVARVSKGEWENPHPCNKDTDIVENQWHIQNALWLTMGSIMTAGSDILPRSPPMRTLNAMWWIFAIIIANSYTANLAAFLTNQTQGSINGIKDLSDQTEITFGTIFGGSTYNFFAESNETTYRIAFNNMNTRDPSAYTKSNDEGVERVIKNKGTYMFLMETTSIEYNVKQNPSLRSVGERFSEKHYAIAVPIGAEYRSNLSVTILQLSERGFLFNLKNRWWKEPNDTEKVDEAISEDTENRDLNLEEVRGIFYTLAIGVCLAISIGFSEFAIHVQNIALEEKTSFKEALRSELVFVLNIWNNKKPIRGTPTASVRTTSGKSSVRSMRSSKENEVNIEKCKNNENGL